LLCRTIRTRTRLPPSIPLPRTKTASSSSLLQKKSTDSPFDIQAKNPKCLNGLDPSRQFCGLGKPCRSARINRVHRLDKIVVIDNSPSIGGVAAAWVAWENRTFAFVLATDQIGRKSLQTWANTTRG
jgi:hypothetical protein